MRLSAGESQAILALLGESLGKDGGELFLFGSRIDDKARGGDIDLLLLMDGSRMAKKWRAKSHLLTAALKMGLGERRIDLSIKTPADCRADPFWSQVMDNAVSLGKIGTVR